MGRDVAACTLGGSVVFTGRGVHTAEAGRVELHPAEPGTGWQLVALDAAGSRTRLDIGAAHPQASSSGVAVGTRTLRTPEHLFAALLGLGITDVVIAFRGPEVPILDGSALPFCEAVHDVGFVESESAPHLVVTREVLVRDGARSARLVPSHRREVRVVVQHDRPWLPQGTATHDLDDLDFDVRVAWARTFVLERDMARLLRSGLGRGATRHNTVIYGAAGAVNGERAPGEAVTHKLLDAIGDLALVGLPVIGRLEVIRGGHALHHELLRRWIADRSAWGEKS